MMIYDEYMKKHNKNHPFGTWFKHPIYGDLGDGLLLFYPHCMKKHDIATICNACCAVLLRLRGPEIPAALDRWEHGR